MTFFRSQKVEKERAEFIADVQRDFAATFKTPQGQRVLAHLAFMFCAFTNKKTHQDQHPEWRQVFFWILDQMGTNDAENLFEIVGALSRVRPVRPQPDSLIDDPLGPEGDADFASWRGHDVG